MASRGLRPLLVAALTLVATLLVAPNVHAQWQWTPLDDVSRFAAEDWRADALAHVVSRNGLIARAAAVWDTQDVYYADGVPVTAARDDENQRTPHTTYGPADFVTRADGFELTPVAASDTETRLQASLVLADLVVDVPLEHLDGGAPALTCTATVTLSDLRYLFELMALHEPEATPLVVAGEAGDILYGDGSVTATDCAFELTADERDETLLLVVSEIARTLDMHWSERLGPTAAAAFLPTYDYHGVLQVAAPATSSDTAALAVASVPTALLEPFGAGVLALFDIALQGTGRSCVVPSARSATDGLTLPTSELAPGGVVWDEALVLGLPLIEAALDAARTSGLVGTLLRAQDQATASRSREATSALASMWPTGTPEEILRLRTDRVSIRLRVAAQEGWPAVAVEAAPGEAGSAMSPIRLRTGHLTMEVYAELDDVDLRLITLDARRAELDLVPQQGSGGSITLHPARFHAERLDSEAGLLSLPNLGAVWVELLLESALAAQPVLQLEGVSGAAPPRLAASEWLDDDSYVLYLRRVE